MYTIYVTPTSLKRQHLVFHSSTEWNKKAPYGAPYLDNVLFSFVFHVYMEEFSLVVAKDFFFIEETSYFFLCGFK